MQKPNDTLDLKTAKKEYFNRLDDPLKVGLTIYIENTLNKKDTTLTHILKVLDGTLNREDISKALDVLSDCYIIESEYVKTGKGRKRAFIYIYKATDAGKGLFEEICEGLEKPSKTRTDKRIKLLSTLRGIVANPAS